METKHKWATGLLIGTITIVLISASSLLAVAPEKIGDQPAIIHRAAEKGRPLVIKLHTWSGDYRQHDPFREWAQRNGWNYIHPDFQGPNNRPEACLSDRVIADIDEAIDFGISTLGADESRVFIVGESGGGHAALGYALRGNRKIKSVQAWVPVTDLELWYADCSKNSRLQKYARDMERITGKPGVFDAREARRRSPAHMSVPAKLPEIHIFAGYHDGHTGSVSIRHSLAFFNHICRSIGQTGISEETISGLCERTIGAPADAPRIGGRKVIFSQRVPNVSVTIFDGGHELLPHHAQSLLGNP